MTPRPAAYASAAGRFDRWSDMMTRRKLFGLIPLFPIGLYGRRCDVPTAELPVVAKIGPTMLDLIELAATHPDLDTRLAYGPVLGEALRETGILTVETDRFTVFYRGEPHGYTQSYLPTAASMPVPQ
jgi:hypothetical protein